jgi:hypothetical protein
MFKKSALTGIPVVAALLVLAACGGTARAPRAGTLRPDGCCELRPGNLAHDWQTWTAARTPTIEDRLQALYNTCADWTFAGRREESTLAEVLLAVQHMGLHLAVQNEFMTACITGVGKGRTARRG